MTHIPSDIGLKTQVATPAGDIGQMNVRRVGEYGHYVAPIEQLLADLGTFLGADLGSYAAEMTRIVRDEQGVHPEEAAILYALTRALRPNLILETGTFKGYSTSEFARALAMNQVGHIVSADLATDTGSAVPSHLLPYVTFFRSLPSKQVLPRLRQRSQRVDLFFHDSLHTYWNAMGELIWFSEFFAQECVIVCHDAKMDYMDDFGVGKAVREFTRKLSLQFRILDTTCGLAIIKWSGAVAATALDSLKREYEEGERRISSPGLLRRAIRKLRS